MYFTWIFFAMFSCGYIQSYTLQTQLLKHYKVVEGGACMFSSYGFDYVRVPVMLVSLQSKVSTSPLFCVGTKILHSIPKIKTHIMRINTANLCNNNCVRDFVETSSRLCSMLNCESGNRAETFLGGIGTEDRFGITPLQWLTLSFCCSPNRA